MRITHNVFFDDSGSCWRVRFRDRALDTKLNIPVEEFNREGVDPRAQSMWAKNVASAWAVSKQSEFTREPAREPMALEQIYDLMKARNPEGVSEATWARNDIHFRNLKRLPARVSLKEVRRDLIDRDVAAEYRDEYG